MPNEISPAKTSFYREELRKLLEAAKQKGVPLDEIAEQIGVSKTTLIDLREGRKGLGRRALAKFADRFGEPPAPEAANDRQTPITIAELRRKLGALEHDKRALDAALSAYIEGIRVPEAEAVFAVGQLIGSSTSDAVPIGVQQRFNGQAQKLSNRPGPAGPKRARK